MAVDPTIDANAGAAISATIVTQVQGHAFLMEAMRHAATAGVVGAREGITQRLISEAGSGQARAQLPGGAGGVPTVTHP
jgi:hypothetical protein